MNKYLLMMSVLFALLFQSCEIDSSPKLSKGAEICYATIQETAQKIAEKYHLSFVGIGAGGGGEDGIWLMSAHFRKYQGCIANIEEARSLLIACADDFIAYINACQELKPYLRNHPFTSRNIDVTIFNCEGPKIDETKPYPAAFGVAEGVISYYVPHGSTYRIALKETYEEAVAILAQERGS
jgi:hypothetical protein